MSGGARFCQVRLRKRGSPRAAKISAVVLDKTGTVTLGSPRVTRVAPADGFTDAQLLAEGVVLVMFYPDRPGMVGKFGTILGNAGINIAGMDVGRKEKRGRACVALSVDDPVPQPVL